MNIQNNYVGRKEATAILGIHYHTLYKLANKKEIEVLKIGKRQVYNVNKYLQDRNIVIEGKERKHICYCRVSSYKQKSDLKNQINYMKEKYPDYEIISDIGSSLNMNRRGLNKIIQLGIDGKIETLIIAYKDRLMRFGYELIENIITKYSKGKIIILNGNEEVTPIEEISQDIVAIMNVYTAKVNGLRKYKSLIHNEVQRTKQ